MVWHIPLFHHLPHSYHDLLHHEDKALVKAGASGLVRKSDPSPLISIEKSIDPGIDRSTQNLGLLVADYIRMLPDYVPETEQAEALIKHWKKILLEQPQRLAEAHLDSWNSQHSRAFWHEHLRHFSTDMGITADHFPNAIDDWERAAGAPTPPIKVQGILKEKQWQDLVMRQRLHNLDLDNMGIKR